MSFLLQIFSKGSKKVEYPKSNEEIHFPKINQRQQNEDQDPSKYLSIIKESQQLKKIQQQKKDDTFLQNQITYQSGKKENIYNKDERKRNHQDEQHKNSKQNSVEKFNLAKIDNYRENVEPKNLRRILDKNRGSIDNTRDSIQSNNQDKENLKQETLHRKFSLEKNKLANKFIENKISKERYDIIPKNNLDQNKNKLKKQLKTELDNQLSWQNNKIVRNNSKDNKSNFSKDNRLVEKLNIKEIKQFDNNTSFRSESILQDEEKINPLKYKVDTSLQSKKYLISPKVQDKKFLFNNENVIDQPEKYNNNSWNKFNSSNIKRISEQGHQIQQVNYKDSVDMEIKKLEQLYNYNEKALKNLYEDKQFLVDLQFLQFKKRPDVFELSAV